MNHNEQTKDICPHCGYCQHCGRGPTYPPYVYPYYPYWGPWIVYHGTTTVGSSITNEGISITYTTGNN